ncbi:hypothetical protein [Ahrensia kielensis]|uniref:hypothetical protein n=1 Tax=Ahrensia kielensis TaxID=76980 RepID=UPI00035F2F99|nr:hypothetical protein [Ahrensia kielensis]
MTGIDHEHTAEIDEAGRWLASLSPSESQAQASLREMCARFNLTIPQACEAVAQALQATREVHDE